MSNIRSTASSSKLLPTQSVERRKKIVLVTDYRQRQHNLSRSIKVEPTRRDYIFQGQWETFLSYEDPEKDVTSAFLVLICDDPSVPKKTSLIKELRIYEHTLPLINPYDRKGENQELGVQLINWAEKVATMEHNSSQIAALTSEVNSSFFKKLGYILENGPHLFKSLELDYISATDCADGPDLKFDRNTNLIKNVLNPHSEEEEWLRIFDEDYKQRKSY
ncbi:unnamed protein product [Psylliodes chrysocephalus]|uniref:N-acetyltransferase domain-containing protein n=1 Tax=Psylliodes chrysocephalus TaxID=3402493 RepID=A0A9P0CDS0_9CUCU|nr:unnamed protein product [Psylliodes chrysocephala]